MENIGLVLSDSGFSGNWNLAYLEEKEMNYIITSACMAAFSRRSLTSANGIVCASA
jgi:hypothetical protein